MSPEPIAPGAAHNREAVHTALKAAFGSAHCDAIVPIGGGASGAFPFRVSIGPRRYMVRVEGPPSPLRNPHQYEAMRIAAAAGIAPRLYHVDETARVAVMDFIDERPLSTFPGGGRALARALGEMVRRAQATPRFPRFVPYPDLVGRLWAWVCQTGLFAPGVLDPCTAALERTRDAYDRDAVDVVSSHNDPVRRNVLFDGQRLWLIDWESACCNDPLVDVAIALDDVAQTQAMKEALLEAWCGGPLERATVDRLTLVRKLTRLYYAGVLLSASAASGTRTDRDLSAPTVAEFRHTLQGGQLRPGTAETKHILGKMYLASFMTDEGPPGLEAAT